MVSLGFIAVSDGFARLRMVVSVDGFGWFRKLVTSISSRFRDGFGLSFWWIVRWFRSVPAVHTPASFFFRPLVRGTVDRAVVHLPADYSSAPPPNSPVKSMVPKFMSQRVAGVGCGNRFDTGMEY